MLHRPLEERADTRVSPVQLVENTGAPMDEFGCIRIPLLDVPVGFVKLDVLIRNVAQGSILASVPEWLGWLLVYCLDAPEGPSP